MDISLIVIIAIVAILGIYLWSTYNGLVTLNVRVDEAWSDITVQLKRRADLIPNLIETVKGYAATVSPETMAHPALAAQAESNFKSAMMNLYAVAEAYPQLQANQNFLSLQAELTDTEDKIMAARRFYNGGVRELNTKIKQFPQVLFVRSLGFKEREFFEVADLGAISEPPAVKF
jgi:LemA protein